MKRSCDSRGHQQRGDQQSRALGVRERKIRCGAAQQSTVVGNPSGGVPKAGRRRAGIWGGSRKEEPSGTGTCQGRNGTELS